MRTTATPWPCRIDAFAQSTEGWPLPSTAALRRSEAAAAATLPPHALMARAGRSVARLALALAPHARRVRVVAGPGNNGGDGFLAACVLQQAGKAVDVVRHGPDERLPDDARWALAQARAAGIAVHAPWPADGDDGVDLFVDALLGIGLSRSPDGELAAAIDRMRRAAAPVLAVDIPSGLDADTGMPRGLQAVRADATLCLLALKRGCFTGHGRDHAGTVWLDPLGVVSEPREVDAWLLARPRPRPRRHASHKGAHGDVLVVGGAAGMTGAATLAARAALAAGAGRVYLAALSGLPAGALPDEVMPREPAFAADPAALARCTVVAGCGGGSAVAAALPALLSHPPRLVLDADALNALAADPALAARVRARARRGQATVLTPHPLEAARCLGTTAAAVQGDRSAAARALAEAFASTVVLKGSGSVVAAPDEPLRFNPTGNAALATAGSGDVLAGWIAGSWAWRAQDEPLRVAADAVWLHGWAADREPGAPAGVLTAGRLVAAMARAQAALAQMWEAGSPVKLA